MNYPSQTSVQIGYDVRSRLETVADGPGRPIARYDYDAFGRIASVKRENNVNTGYTYDAAGQLLAIEHAKNRDLLASSRYALDATGRRTAQTREDGITERYGYDSAGQLTSVDYGNRHAETFTYDPAGNRQRATETNASVTKQIDYATNALNQFTRVGSDPFAYDANGNLTDDGKQRYRYDAQNRLVGVESTTVRAEFFYDARNRCVLRRYFDKMANGYWKLNTADSRVLTYDTRWNLLAERTLDGRAAGEYVHGLRVDEILRWESGDGMKLCPLADGLGNTVALADRQGRVTERYRHSAYGTPHVLTATYLPATSSQLPTQFRFLFTGREWLASLGLCDHRNRYYSSIFGRWLASDPIRFADGPNLYTYCSHDPLGRADSFGTEQKSATGTLYWSFTVNYSVATQTGYELHSSHVYKSRGFTLSYGCVCSNGSATISGENIAWSDGGSNTTGFQFSIWWIGISLGNALQMTELEATASPCPSHGTILTKRKRVLFSDTSGFSFEPGAYETNIQLDQVDAGSIIAQADVTIDCKCCCQ